MHDITIITAGPEHSAILAPLFDAYRQFYQQPSDIIGATAFLTDLLAARKSVVFLALYEGEAVGFTQLYPSFTSLSMQPIWILNDLFVAPRGRRQGVGTALIEHARQFGVASGAHHLTLSTARDNVAAQALYESLGWVRDEGFYHYDIFLRTN